MISPKRIHTTSLASTSKEQYVERINKIANTLFNGNYGEMVKNPKQIYDYLRKKYKDAYASIGGYFTAICKMIDLHPEYPLAEKTKNEWKDYRDTMRQSRNLQYNTNQLSERELEKLVTSDEIKKEFCDMQNNHETHMKQTTHLRYILFAMFLNIRPKRADLGNVYVADDLVKVPNNYREDGNYIVLNKNPRLVMNHYKTRDRYGRIVEPLNDELVKVVKDSLRRYPRTYLFIQSEGENQPYEKNNSYAQFVKRAFGYFFDKAMGASLWRRVYVAENVDFVNTPHTLLIENARLSGQSLPTQLMIYKNIQPDRLRLKDAKDRNKAVKCTPTDQIKTRIKAKLESS